MINETTSSELLPFQMALEYRKLRPMINAS